MKAHLEHLVSLPVSAPDEPELALARGAALASATRAGLRGDHRRSGLLPGPRRDHGGHGVRGPGRMLRRSWRRSAGADRTGRRLRVADRSGAVPPRRSRKPFLLVGSALTSIFVIGVVALVISLAVSIRPTVDQRPSPGRGAIVPSSRGARAPAPVQEAQRSPVAPPPPRRPSSRRCPSCRRRRAQAPRHRVRRAGARPAGARAPRLRRRRRRPRGAGARAASGGPAGAMSRRRCYNPPVCNRRAWTPPRRPTCGRRGTPWQPPRQPRTRSRSRPAAAAGPAAAAAAASPQRRSGRGRGSGSGNRLRVGARGSADYAGGSGGPGVGSASGGRGDGGGGRLLPDLLRARRLAAAVTTLVTCRWSGAQCHVAVSSSRLHIEAVCDAPSSARDISARHMPPGWPNSGHEVIGVDIDPGKVAKLASGDIPFYEPGLRKMLQRQHRLPAGCASPPTTTRRPSSPTCTSSASEPRRRRANTAPTCATCTP